MSEVAVQCGTEVVKLPRRSNGYAQHFPGPGATHWIPSDRNTTYKTACDKGTAGMVTSYLPCTKITCPDCQVAYAHWVFTVREQRE